MFKNGDVVLCTEDWEDNNTKGKLGKIVDIWGSDYKIGFFDRLKRTNGDENLYNGGGKLIKSTWWVRGYLLKKGMTKNKFK